MKAPPIIWSHPNSERWCTTIPGVGEYTVKKLRFAQWVADLDNRKTVMYGSNADDVKTQVEKAIRAFYMTKKGGVR